MQLPTTTISFILMALKRATLQKRVAVKRKTDTRWIFL
jgi:hypothetical protein